MKQAKEWGIIAAVFLILYLTGLHTQVAAFAQRVVLSTGLMTASELPVEERSEASYNFQLKSLTDGSTLNFEEYKGKVVFVNLWATWCAPCIAEMPSIQKLYDKVDSDDIKFVMISLDNSESKARKFVAKKGFTFPTYAKPPSLPKVYQTASIPTTFVISKEGQIVSRKVGMANYDKKSFLNFLTKLENQ